MYSLHNHHHNHHTGLTRSACSLCVVASWSSSCARRWTLNAMRAAQEAPTAGESGASVRCFGTSGWQSRWLRMWCKTRSKPYGDRRHHLPGCGGAVSLSPGRKGVTATGGTPQGQHLSSWLRRLRLPRPRSPSSRPMRWKTGGRRRRRGRRRRSGKRRRG